MPSHSDSRPESAGSLGIHHLNADQTLPTLKDDIRREFLTLPRSIPPKYFYDELGSQLFEQICDTPEYYPTRTESALLVESAEHIIRRSNPKNIVELGSGSSRKTRHLLDAWNSGDSPKTYWPLDVSEEMLVLTAQDLVSEYPRLNVEVLVADYGTGLSQLPKMDGCKLFVFLGSTIGNFSREDAAAFCEALRTRWRQMIFCSLAWIASKI